MANNALYNLRRMDPRSVGRTGGFDPRSVVRRGEFTDYEGGLDLPPGDPEETERGAIERRLDQYLRRREDPGSVVRPGEFPGGRFDPGSVVRPGEFTGGRFDPGSVVRPGEFTDYEGGLDLSLREQRMMNALARLRADKMRWERDVMNPAADYEGPLPPLPNRRRSQRF
jgi:hypothetical protein